MNLIKANYLPSTLDERAKWLGNFAAVLSPIATDLGVTTAAMTRIQSAADWYNYLLNRYLPYVRSFSKGSTTLLEDLDSDPTPQPTVLPTFAPPTAPSGAPDSGIFNFIAGLVNDTILKSDNLTPALKTLLRLDPIPQPPKGAPRVKEADAQPNGYVELSFTRDGSPMVIIEGRRGTETEWTVLDKVAAANYLDMRPNLTPGRTESREYRIRYSDGRNAIGDYSAVKSVSTQA